MTRTRPCLIAAALLALFFCTYAAAETTKAEGDYIIAAAYERSATSPNEIQINLSSVVDRKYGSIIKGLDMEDFAITEDGKPVKLMSAAPITSVSSKTDIVIALDTTGSMSGAIQGAKNSILAFTDVLTKSKMNVKVGGITFGDSVRNTFDLGADYSYRDFVSKQSAFDGADGPENPLDAIAKVMSEFSFRPEAQKIIILITDNYMHQRGEDTSGADGEKKFSSKTAEVAERASGRYVIHTVDAYGCEESNCPRALSKATGGSSLSLPGDGRVDLFALPIKDFILNGYSIKFKSGDKKKREHKITIRVKGAGEKYGEITQNVYY